MKLEQLYRQVVLERSRRPRFQGELPGVTHREGGYNASCGDRLALQLRVEAGRVEDVRFVAQGCAVSVASADLLAETVRGKTVAEALALEQSFTHMIRSGEVSPDLGAAAALRGVHDLPTRVKCATLAWQALRAALTPTEKPPA